MKMYGKELDYLMRRLKLIERWSNLRITAKYIEPLRNNRDKNLLLWRQLWIFLFQNFRRPKIIIFNHFDFLYVESQSRKKVYLKEDIIGSI